MTLEEVAEYLRLKPQTIYTWAQEKKIPAAKLGPVWLPEFFFPVPMCKLSGA